ncbi:hypothetical protein GW17_00049260, partial [Ensete ventricosum]
LRDARAHRLGEWATVARDAIHRPQRAILPTRSGTQFSHFVLLRLNHVHFGPLNFYLCLLDHSLNPSETF